MLLKCISTNYSEVALSSELKEYLDATSRLNSHNIALKIGKYYNCYAVVLGLANETWYLVIDESGVIYPIMYPSVLFSLHDRSLSRCWVLGDIYNYKGERYPA